MAPRDPEADLRAAQSDLGRGKVGTGLTLGHESLRSFLGGPSARDVDLFRPLGGIGEDEDAIVANLQEAPADGQVGLFSGRPVPELTRA